MLKTILIITISVLNLTAVESAYEKYFAYAVAERGVVSAELGTAWNTPAMAETCCWRAHWVEVPG